MIGFPPIQAAPCFLPSIIEGKPTPVLIPAAIDQDPYWRVTRDIAEKMGYPKPAQIHSKFLPGLGMQGKMSSSIPETAIFTTDDEKSVDKKINNTFTGGQPTVELQKTLGANFAICPVFWYLRYFFDTEAESDERARKCKSGGLLCGECKCNLKDATKPFLKEFQARREQAKDQVDKYMFE
jgi:tryptophanyl-tRNA synthetase